MAQLFVLARLRAPIEAVDEEVAAVENQLMIEQSDSLCVGGVAILPFDRNLLPESARDLFGPILDSSVFDDYAVGAFRGVAYAASDTRFVQRMRDGRRMTYGTEGQVMIEVRRTDCDDWQEFGCLPDGYTGAESRTVQREVDGVRFTIESRERAVAADFDFIGLREWTYATRHQPFAVAPTDAKLIVIKTRREFAPVEESVRHVVGDSSRTIMSSERAGVIAVRSPGNPANLYHRIKARIPPSLVEDFITFDIGEEVGAKLEGFSALGDWLTRTREAKKQQDAFKPKRR